MNHQFHMEQSPEHGGPVSQVAQAGSSSPGATASAPVSPYATNPANATYTANGVGYQHANNLHHYNQQQQQQQQQQMHLQQDHRLHHHHHQQPQQHYLTAHHALLQQPGQHQHAIMQQPQATSDDLYPRQPQQQHSPQMATSPAIMTAGQHQQFHQAGPPAPMSPYTGYTNGYHHQHHHPTHHPLHDLGHQQQHQPVSAQQQHQPHPHHQHHHAHHAHQQPHQHHYANHQGHHQSQYQQQHHHHAAFMQLDDAYSAQHGSPAYGQFPQRNADSRTNPTSGLSPVGSVVHQAAGPQPANNIAVQQQFRHYGSTSNNIIKIPTPNTTTTISETMLLNSRSGNVQLATNSSPQLQHHQQNLIKSPASANSDSQSAGCRRQSSSVMSTGSAGSNLSDHQSSLDSPSSALAPNHQLGVPLPMAQVEHGGADQSPSIGLDGPLVAGKPEIKREPKESRLSQLHQQCAVLLDKQQQDQQHMVSINSPNSNPEANVNNATHSGGGGGGGGANNNNNNTLNNGNSNTGRSKRLRTSFKHHQLKEMKRKFQINQNPDAKELRDLSDKTGLSKRVLQVWFQNARAKFRRNNAKAANQQLYDGLGQHNPHMLQFQQQGLQQQSYHHHSHHHHAISIVEQTSMTTVQQQQLQPQQQQQQPQVPQQHQQSSQHHHGLTTAPSQDSPAIT